MALTSLLLVMAVWSGGDAAVSNATEQCLQPPRRGPCRGNFKRWFYDASHTSCKEFSFGGCRGNDNRFFSRSECERICKGVEGQTAAHDFVQTLKIATIYNPPFVIRNTVNVTDVNSRFKGFIPDILSSIRKSGDWFRYELHHVRDGRYGAPGRYGRTWTGGVAEILRGVADIMAADLTISYMRNQVVDFTMPFTPVRLKVLLRNRRNSNSPLLPKTLPQLLDAGYKILVIGGGSTEFFFRYSNVPIYRRIAATFNSSSRVSSLGSALRRMRTWRVKYAFITSSTTIDAITSDVRYCDFTSMPESYGATRYLGFALKKGNFALREKLNNALLRMEENGVMEMLRNKWWPRQCGRK